MGLACPWRSSHATIQICWVSYSSAKGNLTWPCAFFGQASGLTFDQSSSSLPSSIGASLSSSIATSSSLSSSLSLFTPLGSSLPLFSASPLTAGGSGTLTGAGRPDGGALKICCCKSVLTVVVAAAVGILYVPSSFAIASDLPFAYCIFYRPVVSLDCLRASLRLLSPTICFPKKSKPCSDRIA